MRLDFNILWVEDHPDRIEEDFIALKCELNAQGFNAVKTVLPSVDSVKSLMSKNPSEDAFDLILVDFDLGDSGGNGGDAAKAIRDQFSHREMVFYTGKPIKELNETAFEKDIQGVYFASRDTLADETFNVIDNMLRKVVDISHTRGIVMAETSDLDHYIDLCLISSFEGQTEDRQKSFHKKIVEKISGSLDKSNKKFTKLSSFDKFSELLDNKYLVTSSDKIRAMSDFLELFTNLSNKKTHIKTMKDYMAFQIDVRNVLAHVKIVSKNGSKVFQGKNYNVDGQRMLEWRNALRDHREKINAVARDLGVIIEGQ
ncbi:MAG: hypothetical protein HQL68_09095 [Magnetococcales bacterium]|nr:hypothetical protein [Magnetococcales bacterium]